ncbi:MAG: LysR family transcriptional regulator [Burkholderiaceae bacterium]|jgi:DNA-binding transcriptional LysR family regulator
MNIYSVDLNLLKIFDAVYVERSVSRAAHRLNLTQPSVSHGLTRLRTLFGDRLFVRARSGVEPTVAAERIAVPIAAALRELQVTLDETDRFDAERASRTFRLHMSDFGEVVFLPPLLRALRERAPHVAIETRQIAWSEIPDALYDGQIDLAIGYLPSLAGNFESQLLFHEEYVTLTRARAARPRIENPKNYIVVSSHPPTLKYLTDRGLGERIKLSIPHFMVVPAILAETDFAVILPRMAAQRFRPTRSFHIAPLPGPRQLFDVSLYWTRRATTDPANAWLRGLLIDLFRLHPERV